MPARKMKDGRWAVWLDLGKDAQGGRIRRRVEAKTKREAEAKAKDLRDRHQRGEDVTAKPRTLNELLDEWLTLVAALGRAPNTVTSYRDGAKHLRPTLGGTAVPKLRQREFQNAFNELATRLAPASLRLIKSVVTQALNMAIEQQEITTNPAERVRLPETTQKVGRSLSEAETIALVRAAQGHRFGLAVRLALVGLRRGELGGLRWSDVDWTAGTLTVQRQIQRDRVTGLWDVRELKKGAPPRTLALGDATIAALRLHQRSQEHERRAMGWADTGWLFVSTRTGDRAPATALYDAFRSIALAAGIEPARLHDLRHTAATTMLADGEPLNTVSGALGHSSPAVTLSTYSHALPPNVAAATRRLDTKLSGLSTPAGATDEGHADVG